MTQVALALPITAHSGRLGIDSLAGIVRHKPIWRQVGGGPIPVIAGSSEVTQQCCYHAEITVTSGPVIVVSLRRIGARGAQNET